MRRPKVLFLKPIFRELNKKIRKRKKEKYIWEFEKVSKFSKKEQNSL
jgi:hypothetical protein